MSNNFWHWNFIIIMILQLTISHDLLTFSIQKTKGLQMFQLKVLYYFSILVFRFRKHQHLNIRINVSLLIISDIDVLWLLRFLSGKCMNGTIVLWLRPKNVYRQTLDCLFLLTLSKFGIATLCSLGLPTVQLHSSFICSCG